MFSLRLAAPADVSEARSPAALALVSLLELLLPALSGVSGATVCSRSRSTMPVSREAATLAPLLRAALFTPLSSGADSAARVRQ